MMSVGGDEVRRLETFQGHQKGKDNSHSFETIELLTHLGDDEIDDIDDYLSKAEQAAFARATKILERTPTIVGAHIAADNVTKLVCA